MHVCMTVTYVSIHLETNSNTRHSTGLSYTSFNFSNLGVDTSGLPPTGGVDVRTAH